MWWSDTQPALRRRRGLMLRQRRALVLAMAALPLAGCGFRLRQPPSLRFRSIALVGFAPDAPMRRELNRQLAAQVQVLADPLQAEVVLQVLADREDTTAVAQTAFAQVREVQLLRTFGFKATARDGTELVPPTQQQLARNVTYSETAVLAKEAETREVYRAMDVDIAGQVLRRLAALLR
jgi:LPS-assembly lipoprotein